MYHSQLNLCFQNRYRLKSAWWSPQQLEHLNKCKHSLSFFVSRWGGFFFLFALQHHPNWWWFSVLWELLHLTHLEPWIWQDIAACSYHQQFLHWRMPGFMLAPQMVAINFPTIKHLLIRSLALLPLWTSQISIQTINMSDFGDILITHGFEMRTMLLKIWFCLMMLSTSLDIRYLLELS